MGVGITLTPSFPHPHPHSPPPQHLYCSFEPLAFLGLLERRPEALLRPQQQTRHARHADRAHAHRLSKAPLPFRSPPRRFPKGSRRVFLCPCSPSQCCARAINRSYERDRVDHRSFASPCETPITRIPREWDQFAGSISESPFSSCYLIRMHFVRVHRPNPLNQPVQLRRIRYLNHRHNYTSSAQCY
jgi:hypothetical protein